jgi:hypothetical protein
MGMLSMLSKMLCISGAAGFLFLGAANPARAQAERSCATADLRGSYGFSLKGTNTEFSVLYALTGRFASTGDGVLNGTATQSVNGAITTGSFTAKYIVNPDCTGAASLSFGGGTEAGLSFVLVSDGQEILFIDADTGTVEQGSAKRIFVEKAAYQQ